MIDTTAATFALRNRARTLTVCTTGSTTLSATATGYARAAGSFLTDGFVPGMEITPSGFATNTVDVLTSVTALTLTTANARTVEASASGRTISVTLPVNVAWDNIALDPPSGRPYLTEELVPATNTLITLPASTGTLEETGLYVLTWYGLSDRDTGSIRSCVDALKALFSPGTTVTAGSNIVRVRTDTSVRASQLIPQGNGWTACVLTVPWKTRTTNAIAA